MKSSALARPAWLAALGCSAALGIAGCSHQPEPKLVPASGHIDVPPASTSHPDQHDATIHLSEGVRRRCNLPDTPREDPQFDFDEAALRPRGESILDGVATCLKEGALKDEGVTIIGHADPRGSDEYNQQLGMERAEAAQQYLNDHGVTEGRVTVRSRGEQDAVGTDSASWQLDRRIDVEETTPQAP
jgi:outer membrane protein OmpA-like peptidoglycan-associated protein